MCSNHAAPGGGGFTGGGGLTTGGGGLANGAGFAEAAVAGDDALGGGVAVPSDACESEQEISETEDQLSADEEAPASNQCLKHMRSS